MENRLIQFVRENSFIYDKKHDLYRNQPLKDKKWMELAKEVKVPVDKLKKRWKSLRDRFFRLRKNAASGSGQKSPDGISYKYSDSLQFLCDEESGQRSPDGIADNYFESFEFLCDVKSENTRTTIDFTKENEEEDEESFNNIESIFVDEDSRSTFSIDDAVSPTPVRVSRKRKSIDTDENEMLNVLQTMKSFAAENVTPFRTFLESVALTVESANCSILQQARLQMKILEVVQEAIDPNLTNN